MLVQNKFWSDTKTDNNSGPKQILIQNKTDNDSGPKRILIRNKTNNSPKYTFQSATYSDLNQWNTMMILIKKYDPKNNILIQLTVQTTPTYPCWFWYQQQQQQIEEKETRPIVEEMFLPRTLEIKFGEEYSRKWWRRNVFNSHTRNKIWGRV